MIKKVRNFVYTQRDQWDKRFDELQSENKALKEEIAAQNAKIDRLDSLISGFITKFRYYDPEISNYARSAKTELLLCGFYGGFNLGDELMLDTLLEHFSDIKDCHITVMLANNDEYDFYSRRGVTYIHYPQTPFDYDALASRFDAVMFGGGALIDDRHYRDMYSREMSLGTTLIELSEKMLDRGKTCIWCGLSTNDSFSDPLFIAKLNDIIPRLTYCSIRDTHSLDLLKRCGADVSNVVLSHDIIIANPKFYKKGDAGTDGKTRIGIVFVGSIDDIKEGTRSALESVCDYFEALGTEYEINLMPFYDFASVDSRFLVSLKDSLGNGRINVLPYVNTASEICDVISRQSVIISMRYHASLIAVLMKIPLLTILLDKMPHYPNKMRYVSEKYDNEKDYILFSEMDKEKIKTELDRILSKRAFSDCTQYLDEEKKEIERLAELIEKSGNGE